MIVIHPRNRILVREPQLPSPDSSRLLFPSRPSPVFTLACLDSCMLDIFSLETKHQMAFLVTINWPNKQTDRPTYFTFPLPFYFYTRPAYIHTPHAYLFTCLSRSKLPTYATSDIRLASPSIAFPTRRNFLPWMVNFASEGRICIYRRHQPIFSWIIVATNCPTHQAEATQFKLGVNALEWVTFLVHYLPLLAQHLLHT